MTTLKMQYGKDLQRQDGEFNRKMPATTCNDQRVK